MLSRWFEHATKGDNNKKHRRGRPEKKANVVDFIFIRRCVCHTNASLVRNRYCCEWMNQVWSPLFRFSFTLLFQGNKNVEKNSHFWRYIIISGNSEINRIRKIKNLTGGRKKIGPVVGPFLKNLRRHALMQSFTEIKIFCKDLVKICRSIYWK